VEFRLLGPLDVVTDDGTLTLGSARQRTLLVLLLVHADEWVSVDRAIDELWGDGPPATAQHAVQVYVSGLRKLLRAAGDEVALGGSPSGYVLAADPEQIDARRFERLIGEGRRLAADRPADARQRFEQALALWRGPPLAEFAEFGFAAREAERLEELRELALEGTAEAALACGEHHRAIAMLTSLIAANPLREGPRRLLMLALYRAGRHAEALAVYRDLRLWRAIQKNGMAKDFSWKASAGEYVKLYEKAKTSQWNVSTDIDWDIDVDPWKIARDPRTIAAVLV